MDATGSNCSGPPLTMLRVPHAPPNGGDALGLNYEPVWGGRGLSSSISSRPMVAIKLMRIGFGMPRDHYKQARWEVTTMTVHR